MNGRRLLKRAAYGLAAATAAAAAGYAGLVVWNRRQYGTVKGFAEVGKDSLLDRFLPNPEVAEHHRIEIHAPADVVISAAREFEVLESPMIRAIFRIREMALGGGDAKTALPTHLVEQMQSIGWVILAERPGREVVFGAVTQPWHADPVFRSIPATEFRDFAEPGYVKIVWTLRADPIDHDRTMFHTETRVATTDADARARFRTYWSFVAPGVELIRLLMLRPIKKAAERQKVTHAA